ncbi:MAG: DUF1223 domain-containing protein [Rhodospirillales bacterium]
MRPILVVLAFAAALATTGLVSAQDRPPVVIELFTSQGCSSCPPSDAYLGELSKRSDVIALSFHVDYWDYIGWADPFAKPGFTERQRSYARSLKQRYVYTPEMVVNGMGHDSGIDRSTVRGLIDQAKGQTNAQPGAYVAVSIADRGPAGVTVSVPAFATDEKLDVWLVAFDPQHKTQVVRGENRGRELIDHNVVRNLALLTKWDGKAATWTVSSDKLADCDGVAILVQRADLGTMVGAAQLRRTSK